MKNFIEIVTGDLGEKKRWRQYKARAAALPHPYRTTVAAIERYLLHAGSQGYDASMQLWEDLADLFERAAADHTPIRDIVGVDPVEFADTFASNYGTRDWRTREQRRLRSTIAEAEQGGPEQ
ncbi:MAG: DUF1048 domain-containing protein [Propionicimonas sp.]|uniref:DUF1048 domain-containing protein n=1 Tax=Propionicimonas sp. TaxID=1955623 RepID=UPI002B1FA5BB|nr:DUF1048 domain-containing protein [Propionicimonas sp.]MEA4945385.1 DUF1048 domain-containing protein [Propionicimonas sp.]MEA5055125.1 DUF1048 domain-containing protein [Propionicimonas sp.]MEA5118714.1 DUF1048 domain-containing protein [Propionicimonas sp.]